MLSGSHPCLQDLLEAAVMYAERGAQAEYEAFTAVSALVPPAVADAIPPQLRQLAPRPPVQNDVIDAEPISAPTQMFATLAAANAPETLLANQLGEQRARDRVLTPWSVLLLRPNSSVQVSTSHKAASQPKQSNAQRPCQRRLHRIC